MAELREEVHIQEVEAQEEALHIHGAEEDLVVERRIDEEAAVPGTTLDYPNAEEEVPEADHNSGRDLAHILEHDPSHGRSRTDRAAEVAHRSPRSAVAVGTTDLIHNRSWIV